MQRLYVYNGALAIIGVSLGLKAGFYLIAGQSSIILWLMAVAGCGMVVGAVYEAMTTDPDGYSINTYALFGLVFAALLALSSIVLQLLS
jgi:hypothetical protein